MFIIMFLTLESFKVLCPSCSKPKISQINMIFTTASLWHCICCFLCGVVLKDQHGLEKFLVPTEDDRVQGLPKGSINRFKNDTLL